MIEKRAAMLSRENPKRNISQETLAPLIIMAVVLAAYSMVLLSNFGVMDDYTFLYNAIMGSNETFTLLAGAGRPLNALLLDLGFYSAGSIENLFFLRLITLTGIWVLGCGLYFFSRLHSLSFAASLAMACGVILLPSFQVYASWAQHFTTPFAGAIALLSAFVLTPACTIRERSRMLAISLSTFLLLTAIVIYQPIAMMFCVGTLISVLSRPNFHRDWRLGRIMDVAIVFVAAMLFGLIIFKFAQHIYPSNSLRYGLVHNIDEKIKWFFSEPLVNAVSLYSVSRSIIVQFSVVFVLGVGAFLFIRKTNMKIASLMFFCVFLSLFGSYAPNLATAENWASYRSIGALAASLVALIVILVVEPVFCIKEDGRTNGFLGFMRIPLSFLLAIVLVFIVMLAQRNVLNGFVLPNVTELNNLASFLNDENRKARSDNVEIIIKPSAWSDSAAEPIAYDEFGMHSSLHDYYAKPIVEIVLRSMNIFQNSLVIMSDDAMSSRRTHAGESLLVDFPRLVTSQRFKTNEPDSLAPNRAGVEN